MIQLTFGLLILSAVAPTSMSEERQRGSLDLLATTTLSTRAIVVGKWLGTLRLVPFLALGPGLVALAMATADVTPPVPQPGRFPPEPSLSTVELLFGVTLLVATILIHGALIASVGVALAVWIKQQSRAIAASVVFAVMMSVGWPTLAGVGRLGGAGMMCLSPLMVAGGSAELLSDRFPGQRYLVGWTMFWDIECLVLALGLVWLTIRTFDRCLCRIPERPRRTSVLSDVVVLLAGLIGVGCLFETIVIWIPGSGRAMDFGAVASALLIAVGFLLLAVMAPLSITRTGMPQAMTWEPVAAVPDRGLFASRWWESFRLVLLLAIGPALIGLALVTVHRPVRVLQKVTKLPDGSEERIETLHPSNITYVITTDATGGQLKMRKATDAEIAARPVLPVRSRTSLLTTGFLAVLTVLAHGAAVVSLGLALGIGFRRRRRAIAATVAIFLIVTMGWPLLFLIYLYDSTHAPARPNYPPGLALASSIPAIVVLLIDHPPREDVIAQIVWWATFWDLLLILLTVIACTLAIWTLDRRARAYASPERVARNEEPVNETVLVGD